MPVLLGSTLVFFLMIKDGMIGRLEGGALFVGVLVYVIASLVQARKEDPNVSEDLDPEVIKAAKAGGLGRVSLNIFLIVIGALLLVLGADRMVVGGESIARFYGVPDAIIGLTLFAFGTSLPELATSVVAAMKKEGDIIVGNAVGSCIFNLLAVVGLAGVVSPLKGEGVTVIHLAVMLALTVILMPMMLHRMKLDRWEGALLVTGYLGFTAWLIVA
jgi:cation:H+ antiporter